ncbi:MAG: transposase [bacterium]|nr:transposase [bacterium]
MQLQTYLAKLFSSITTLTNSQRKFLTEIVFVVFAMRGRANFTNMSRYTHYHESTIRRQYDKPVDFVALNRATIQRVQASHLIGVFDCSFLPKSGDCTYGRDKFWSGTDKKAQYGLEISVVGCIDTQRKQAWTVDVRQTPAELSSETKDTEETYPRVNFYLDQVDDLIRYPDVPDISHWVSDGYYAKTTVFDRIALLGKHLVTKLRCDANVKYFAIGKQRNGTRGKYKTYDGKVDYADLSRFIDEGRHPDHPHLHMYRQVVYGVRFTRKLNVVILVNTTTQKSVVLASTDLTQDALTIVNLYKLRFQIEFIFRDAKQFAGLTHCQARDKKRLHFHFNLSCSAINLARAEMELFGTASSMNSYIRKAYNTRVVERIIDNLDLGAEFDIHTCPDIQEVINWGVLEDAA